jgi:hypothetical protein
MSALYHKIKQLYIIEGSSYLFIFILFLYTTFAMHPCMVRYIFPRLL